MKPISYDGVAFAGYEVGVGVVLAPQGPSRSPVVLRRAGGAPIHAGVAQDAGGFTVEFTANPNTTLTVQATLLKLLGALGIDRVDERPFVLELADGVSTQVTRDMAIATYRWIAPNAVQVDFSASDPIWRSLADTTAGTPGTANAAADQGLNVAFATGITGWQSDTASGTATWSHDATDGHAATGSLKLDWTAPNFLAAIGAAYRNTAYVPCVAGEEVTISHWCKTTNANVIPLLRVTFYSVSGLTLASVAEANWTPTINTWTQRTMATIAPDTAVKMRITGAAVTQTVISQVATVRFDDYVLTFPNRIPFTNAGQATVHPTVTIGWTAQRSVRTATVGWTYRKTITLTNNGTQPLSRRPWRLSLGSTTALVSGAKALASGDDVRLLDPAGRELPRTLIGWNTATSLLWFLLDLQPGQGATFAMIYGNPSAGTPATLTGADRPVFDVDASTNSTWVYLTAQTERTDAERGLWYINKGETTPSIVRYDAPGSWRPYLYQDNRDAFAQDPWSAIEPSAGDPDSFAILRARRTWQGGASTWTGIGEADGVALSSALPIASINIDYQWLNPNGFAQFVMASRESGGGSWAIAHSRTTVRATLTTETAVAASLLGTPRHLYLGVIPVDEGEIDPSRTRDTASVTSASTTQLTDAAQAWSSSEWVGAWATLLSGAQLGQRRKITASLGQQVSWVTPALSGTPAAGDRFGLRFTIVPYAEARSGATCEITFTVSDIAVGTLSTEVEVYDLNARVLADGGGDATAYPVDAVGIGYAYTGRRLLLKSTETLVIDSERTRADLYAAGAWSASVPWAVDPTTTATDDATGAVTERMADDWLPLGPGAHTIAVAETASGDLDVDVAFRAGYAG